MKELNFSTRRLTESAMMLSIATADALICAWIPFLNFPFGGGITIASMLPIVIVSYLYGMRWGILTGFSYGIIQMALGHATVAALFTPTSDSFTGIRNAILICLVDYILAYTVIGIGGLFRKRQNRARALCLGSIVALTLRYVCHVFSGTIFYGAWADWFFSQETINGLFGQKILETFSGASLSFVYSLIYNGLYMIPEIMITALAALVVARIPAIRKRLN